MKLSPVATVFSCLIVMFWAAFVATISSLFTTGGWFWITVGSITMFLASIPHLIERS